MASKSWFGKLSKAAKAEYLKKHPGSKLGRAALARKADTRTKAVKKASRVAKRGLTRLLRPKKR